jgi:hypothetical protein
MAVDVKFSGSFYAAGMYQDKATFMKDTGFDGSTALYYQRLRLKTEFVVSPGLSLITRADIMERAWGAARTTPGTALDSNSQGTIAENQNIAFDYGYVQYASPIGVFAAGYMPNGAWATDFGNSESSIGKISYMLPIGNFTLIAQVGKGAENSVTARNPLSATNAGYADADNDIYYLMGIYSWKGGQAGLGLFGINYAGTRPAASGAFRTQYLMIEPYAIVQLGPVKITTEVDYLIGKTAKFDSGLGDIDISSLNAWINAVATFGPVYFGGTLAYVAGDDPATTNKNEGGFSGGTDFSPCLIMFNYERTYWAGAINGYNYTATAATSNANPMTNAWFAQGKIGGNPIPALDVNASLSYAKADKNPTGVLNSLYGYEIDVTGTYKITNNLSYMLGLGYLFTGDYYKGASNDNTVRDNYLLINKLTLTF